ncbi:MAG: DUF6636 domain-containing protein [Syntrophothermus sp.]
MKRSGATEERDAVSRRGRAGSFAGAVAVVLAGLAVAAPAASALQGFQSPSRNIGCVISAGSVRCDIAKKSWKPPPKPANCPLDFGFAIGLGKHHRARFLCAGDTALGMGPVLGYGSSIRRGRFRCASRTDGVRCVNLRNGHGFFISRQRYRLF